MGPPSPETRPPCVFVERSDDKLEALAAALAGGALDHELERVRGDRDPATMRVAIKANIMGAVASRGADATYTDPDLVARLAGHLRERGFARVSVVDSRVTADEGVVAVATRLGYQPDGYELVDLSEHTAVFDYGGVLGQHAVAPVWRDADLRISFAKSKTQWECFYSGAMANVLGCLPEPDKRRWYRGRGHTASECVRTALDALPVHFGIVDAWTGRDGSGRPGRRGRARRTGTVLASANLVALDWVVGEKMGIDPALNPVVQEALHRWGRIELERYGDLMAWDPWDRPGDATVALGGLVGARRGWTIQ